MEIYPVHSKKNLSTTMREKQTRFSFVLQADSGGENTIIDLWMLFYARIGFYYVGWASEFTFFACRRGERTRERSRSLRRAGFEWKFWFMKVFVDPACPWQKVVLSKFNKFSSTFFYCHQLICRALCATPRTFNLCASLFIPRNLFSPISRPFHSSVCMKNIFVAF